MDVGRRGILAGEPVPPARATPAAAAFQGELQPEARLLSTRVVSTDSSPPSGPRSVRSSADPGRSHLRCACWCPGSACAPRMRRPRITGSAVPEVRLRLVERPVVRGPPSAGLQLAFPTACRLFSAALVGIVSCVVTTACMTHLVRRETGHRHYLASLWLAAAVVANLVVGRGRSRWGWPALGGAAVGSHRAAGAGGGSGGRGVAGQPAGRAVPAAGRPGMGADAAGAHLLPLLAAVAAARFVPFPEAATSRSR